MNAFGEAWAAVIGWLDLIAGRDDAAARFNPSRQGLINAVGCYLAVVLLGLVVATVVGVGPSWAGGLAYLALQLPPLATVWAVAWLTGLVVRPKGGMLGLLVAATYAMAFVEAIRLVLGSLAGAPVNNALLGAFAFMLYRAARGIAGFGRGVSLAFAALAVAALVTETVGLYMLLTGGRGID